MADETRIGIDLGGTKIEGIVLDGAGRTLARERIPTERERGYDHIVAATAALVARVRPMAPGAIR